MVKSVLRHLSLATLLVSLFCIPLPAKELADYRVGDKLETDIAAPERITVIDTEATQALKEKEALTVPVICRFYPGVADEAETAMRRAFVNARDSFLKSVEQAFKQPPLDEQTTSSPEFQQLVGAFQSRNTGFPLNTDLAARWARGETDLGFQESLSIRLRETMKRPVRPYGLPDGLKLTYTVRLVSLQDRNTTPTLETVEREGQNVTRTNLITLPWARTKLQESFDESERAWGKFAAGFVKENCFPDAQLTRQARAQKTDLLQVADTYEAGQTIARHGDVVDAKILAAITQAREKIATAQVEQHIAGVQTTAAVVQERNRWLIVALAGVSLAAVLAMWVLRQRRHQVLLPAAIAGEGGADTVRTSELRARVAPHLAQLMMNKLFQGLLSQRKQMIATQETAAAEMAELEAQLERVRAPLEERMRTYEQRIAELEKQLAVRGEENQELLKAKIGMIRKQLQTARAKGRVELN